MSQVLYFMFFILSCTGSVSCRIVFATPGQNAIIHCSCSDGCYSELVRWARMKSNGSLEILNTKCEKSPCRFTSKRLDDNHVALTIEEVKSGDSGRYYCGEHLSSYLQFTDNGTVLMVGDAWTNRSEVHLLNEWVGEGGSPELDWSKAQTSNSNQELSEWRHQADASEFRDLEHTELRCVVTGLSVPWVSILWRSSQESWKKDGQTWSLTDTEGGYRVESQLRIGRKVKSSSEYEDEIWLHARKMNLDRMVTMDEELWCEVKFGVNHSIQSLKFSFPQQTHAEWCSQLLYGEVALCAVCVCLLTLVTWHCLHHRHKGSGPLVTEVSPTLEPCGDLSSGVTYAQLDIKKQSKKERQQTQKKRQENGLVYSEVRYKLNEE